MKTVSTLDEFVKYNHRDLVRIVYKVFPKKKWMYYELDDVVQSVYLSFAKSKTVERWSPDGGAQFSTYIFRCIQNNLISYFGPKLTSREKVIFGSVSISTQHSDSEDTGCSTIDYYLGGEDNNEFTQLTIWLNQIRSILEKYDETCHTRVIPFNVLLGHLMDDMTDNDIATKYNMTNVNVGCQKRKLVELIKKCESGSIYNTISINKDKMNGKKRKRKTSVNY